MRHFKILFYSTEMKDEKCNIYRFICFIELISKIRCKKTNISNQKCIKKKFIYNEMQKERNFLNKIIY